MDKWSLGQATAEKHVSGTKALRRAAQPRAYRLATSKAQSTRAYASEQQPATHKAQIILLFAIRYPSTRQS
eukprot:6190147-Pleurochrysis_carterae.AAC.2